MGAHVSSGGDEVWIHETNKRQLTDSLQRQMENWTEKLSRLWPQQVFTSLDGRRPAPSPGDGDAIALSGSDILHYHSLWILLPLSKSSLQQNSIRIMPKIQNLLRILLIYFSWSGYWKSRSNSSHRKKSWSEPVNSEALPHKAQWQGCMHFTPIKSS